jgi:hypothetical protein
MSAEKDEIPTPPKPKLTFRVGVVGHRPNRLGQANEVEMRNVIRSILAAIKDEVAAFQAGRGSLFEAGSCTLRVVSPLAEGSDRIVADEAMNLGYQLQCPMPLPQSEYERDFVSPGALVVRSLEEFRELLDRGRKIGGDVHLELDGSRDDEGRAYGATGRIVINHSDILVVIWDGKPSQGQGGTVEKLQEAVRFGVPVVWIDAVQPHPWCVIRTEDQLSSASSTSRAVQKLKNEFQEIKSIVTELLEPPIAPHKKIKWLGIFKPDPRETFFCETLPRMNLAFVWKTFRDALGDGKINVQSLRVKDFESALADEWPTEVPGVEGWVNQALRKYYAWSDKLADFFADWYRSAFVSAFLFSVVAVVLALSPLAIQSVHESSGSNGVVESSSSTPAAHGDDSIVTICAIAEPLVILYIILLIAMSWWGRWHERWMDYRLIAELVRQLRFLIPLGGGRPFPRTPPHLAGYGDPARTWMYWYVRAIERDVGMPNARIDMSFLSETLKHVRRVLRSQLRFHTSTFERSERIESRLHLTGICLFGTTFVACLLHFLPHGGVIGLPRIELPDWLPPYFLAVLCAVLPALAAALAAINNQGEFGRIAKRSEAMSERLVKLDLRVDNLLEQPMLQSREVIVIAYELAQLMVDEVLDWRVVFKDRPPVLPA